MIKSVSVEFDYYKDPISLKLAIISQYYPLSTVKVRIFQLEEALTTYIIWYHTLVPEDKENIHYYLFQVSGFLALNPEIIRALLFYFFLPE